VSVSHELTDSLEDYLEAILHIVDRKHAARAKDISRRMRVSNSSVTGALHALSERGLVNYAPYDVVTLTDEGERLARQVARRHEALRKFFVRVLSVDDKTAEDAACRMEHAVPPVILERFIAFVEFVESCPRCGEEWLRAFAERCRHGRVRANCETCVTQCLARLKRKGYAAADAPVADENSGANDAIVDD
jgi:DtxR family Mn-dependent transcriptional regulator